MNEPVSNQVLHPAIADVVPDPSQPRKHFDDEAITRLAVSIKAKGLLQPIRVMLDKKLHMFIILTGESRWRAAKLAGRTHVPVIVVEGELSEADRLEDRLTENECRDALTSLDMARALQRLKVLKGCTSKALAAELGFSEAALSKAEALLSLPADIQELVGNGPNQIAAESAYLLSRLPDEASQRELAQAIITRHLPRQAVAEAVQAKVGKRNVRTPKGRVSCKLDGGVSVTVSTADALTWEGLLDALDSVRKQAKKLADKGDPVSALARVLRAS